MMEASKNAPVRIPEVPSYNCLTSKDLKMSRAFTWSRQNVPLPQTTHSMIVCFERLLRRESPCPAPGPPRPKPHPVFRTFSGARSHFPNFLAVPGHLRLRIPPHAVADLHQAPQKKSFGENYTQGQSFLQSPQAPHRSPGVPSVTQSAGPEGEGPGSGAIALVASGPPRRRSHGVICGQGCPRGHHG